MSENKGVSPYGENGKLTEVTTFTMEDGTDDGVEVKMTVDISLDGNTGGVTFTTVQPDKLKNFINANFNPTVGFSEVNRNPSMIDVPVKGELLERIKNDPNGVVESNYNKVIENTKKEIIDKGGSVDVFEESLLDNKNLDVKGAVENYTKTDLNNDGLVGSNITSEGGDNNEPEEFKAPQK